MKEEEELSELQLRLLALQSASKKWHQKEQQVMRRSKERITKVVQEKSANSPAAPPNRRVTTRSISSSSSGTPAADRTRTRTRSNVDRDRDRTKATTRPPGRDRPKAGPKIIHERGRTPAKLHTAKKTNTPGKIEQLSSLSVTENYQFI